MSFVPDPEETLLSLTQPSLILSVRDDGLQLGTTFLADDANKNASSDLWIFAEQVTLGPGKFQVHRNLNLSCHSLETVGEAECQISTAAESAATNSPSVVSEGDGKDGESATAPAGNLVLSIEDVVSLRLMNNLRICADGGAGADGQGTTDVAPHHGGKGGNGTDAGTITIAVGFEIL